MQIPNQIKVGRKIKNPFAEKKILMKRKDLRK